MKIPPVSKEIPQQIETTEGVVCWRENRAIDKVVYIFREEQRHFFSTVLMLAVPAQIAGCKEIILCSPPQKTEKLILLFYMLPIFAEFLKF